MRFSLFYLLLIFPSWAIAYFISPYATLQQVRISWRHDSAANEIRHIRIWADSEQRANPQLDFSDYDKVQLWAGLGGKHDPWGNEYQVIELDRRGLFDSDSTFHAYSYGADGSSRSDGDDDDDINSWNYDRGKHYGRMIAADYARKNLWRTVWLTPIIYAGLFFF